MIHPVDIDFHDNEVKQYNMLASEWIKNYFGGKVELSSNKKQNTLYAHTLQGDALFKNRLLL